ncbi:MAG: hypothetical protein ACYC9L_16095, partial [Sulfuricaulis sp.]
KGAMMSCHNGNGYAGGLPRLDVVKMGDFQVAMGGGVWVAVGGDVVLPADQAESPGARVSRD